MIRKLIPLLLLCSAVSAQSPRYYDKTTDPPLTEFNVKGYGAKLNGTDDLSYINAAILAAYNAGGGTVRVPYSTSNIGISGPIIMRTNVALVCDRGVTVFLLAGSNSAVVQSLNAPALFGTNTDAGPHDFTFDGCTFDGNKDNQSSITPDLQNGISIYGSHFTLRDLVIKNILGHGIRSEWYQYGEQPGGMESYIENVTTDNVGRDGWLEAGPHDLIANKFISIDAGQEADNTYYGVYVDTYGSANFIAYHGWHRSTATNRVKYQASSIATAWVGSSFEGGRSEFESRNNDVLTNCRFYAMRGTAGTGAALIDIHGNYTEIVGGLVQGTAGQGYYAVNLGAALDKKTAVHITGLVANNFDVYGPVNFTGDAGYNNIEIIGYASTAGGPHLPYPLPNYLTRAYIAIGGATYTFVNKAPVTAMLDGTTSENKFLDFATLGVHRWQILSDLSDETGSNAGSNFHIDSKNDVGGAIATPLSIIRATGQTSLGVAGTSGGAVIANGALINGATVRQTLTSTYTVPANVDVVRFIQAGTLAASTVTLPTAIADGQPIQFINYAGQITSLTFSPAVTGWTNTSTLASNTGIRIRWDSTAGLWYLESINAAFANGTSFAAPGPIGSGTASTGAFSTLSATGAITSTLATGTAPFTVASTTNVANLNASLLNGTTFASPAAIGTGTPAAITGTTVTGTSFSHGVTTICDVHSASPTDRTGAGTGTESLPVLAACTIPAGIMGTQGTLRVTVTWHRSATGTDTSTYYARLATANNAISGGTPLLNGFTNAGSGNVTGRTVSIMDNTDATHQQIALSGTGVEAGFNAFAIATGNVDTGSVSYVVFNCANTTSTADSCGIYGYRVDLYLP